MAQGTARTSVRFASSPARARTASPALSTVTDEREAAAPARWAPRAATGNSRRATTSTRSQGEGSGRRHSRPRRGTARRVEAVAGASGSAARRRSGWRGRRAESVKAPPARRRCSRRRATRIESSRTAVAAAAHADETPRPAPRGNTSRSTRRTSTRCSRRHWRRSRGPSRVALHGPDSGHRRTPRRAAASRAPHREWCTRARHSRPRCSAAPAGRART